MSNTDDFAEQKAIEQEKLQTQSLMAKPLHRQFTAKLVAILLTVIVTITLIFIWFYQQNEQSRLLIESELTPLKQQFEQLKALQKAEYLINELLFTDSGINFVELQTQLVTVNKQLIWLENSNKYLYQQWLNINEAGNDIAIRIQQNYGRNEQLKQSSIIQLQLMWFSVTPIINKKIAQQTLLFKQLQADQVNDNITLSRANAYISSIQQLHNLQQLKNLSAELLTRFEALTIHTSMDDFDLLRLGIKKILSQRDFLKINDKTKVMIDFNQQIDNLEKIVLTQQNALAKWQGYIRLAQKYQLELEKQKNDLMQILAKPQEKIIPDVSSLFDDRLVEMNVKFNNHSTQKELALVFLLAIGLSLFVFCYLLWRLREQIKTAIQQSVLLIQKSMLTEYSGELQANCAETQKIMQQVQGIAMPAHNELAFQKLVQECRVKQQIIDKQAQKIVVYTQSINQQQSKTSKQAAFCLDRELQRYKYLEYEVLSLLQQQQAKLFNKSIINELDKKRHQASLFSVYQQLRQFYLISKIDSENVRLTLVDVNLVDEINAILINKQTEQQKFNNQLYFSYDEQLLVNAKLDIFLFEQLLYLLIDITLQGYQDTQLHLNLQLRDKNSGQQLVRFVVTVRAKTINTLPNLITLLINSQTIVSKNMPLIDMFNLLIEKQYGENILAQLIDDGFQFSFELPLAFAASPVLKAQKVSKFEDTNVTNVILLSNNGMLTELLGGFIHSTWAQFEVLDHIDIFNQQFTKIHLSKHKVDILIVASDIVQKSIDLITQQLNRLPASLKPKLMVLQSGALSYDEFGFYSQPEQLLFKDVFLQNIKELLVGEANTNQLLLPEQCQQNHYLASELPVILAVHSPQQYQNFQRLLCLLGFQVHVVSHAEAQRDLWQTGLYCILFTEFPVTALLKMTKEPFVDVAVFSLTDEIPNRENNIYFENWHISQLAEQSTLTELSVVLAPWLQYVKASSSSENIMLTVPEKVIAGVNKEISENNYRELDERVITELAGFFTENKKEAIFDFSKYLHHQGSVELALFMFDDYTQDNHQKLDILINAIKAKNFDKAKEAVIDLQLNAKILAASELDKSCTQWLKLLNGNSIPNSLKEVNILLKETRAALIAIDNYAESL